MTDAISLKTQNIKEALIQSLERLSNSGINYLPELKEENVISVLPQAIPKSTSELLTLKNQTIGDCRRCGLCEGRNNIVFGVGDPDADLVFVGEAPGAEEDKLGQPFIGRSGKLLWKMAEAMGFSKETAYICNVIKCRPPENRNPTAKEIEACEPFLKAQLDIIKPKVIVALGSYACKILLQTKTPMAELRGNWGEYNGIKLMPTFHPAYLLRSPSKKKETWADLQEVMREMGLK